MKKSFKLAVIVYLLTCASGAFIAAAGGAHWGTTGTGLLAAYTLAIATALALCLYINGE